MTKTETKENKLGRPSGYDPIFCDKVDDYLQENQDSYERIIESVNEKTGKEAFKNQIKVKLPTMKGFAKYINVPERTLYDWKAIHPEFSQSLEKIKTEQHDRLINMSLGNEYNSTISKLILSSNHGYAERTKNETEHIIPDEETRERVGSILRRYVNSKRNNTSTGEGVA